MFPITIKFTERCPQMVPSTARWVSGCLCSCGSEEAFFRGPKTPAGAVIH